MIARIHNYRTVCWQTLTIVAYNYPVRICKGKVIGHVVVIVVVSTKIAISRDVDI